MNCSADDEHLMTATNEWKPRIRIILLLLDGSAFSDALTVIHVCHSATIWLIMTPE